MKAKDRIELMINTKNSIIEKIRYSILTKKKNLKIANRNKLDNTNRIEDKTNPIPIRHKFLNIIFKRIFLLSL